MAASARRIEMRVFLAVAAAAVAIACTERAQSPSKVAKVAVLAPGTVVTHGHLTDAFVRGLAELGYIGGRNVEFDIRYADGKPDRLPVLAQEIAGRKPDLVFAASALAVDATRKSGVTQPIVFALPPDPVAEGFAASLARPGGNMTGLTSQSPDLGAKRVEILREVSPKAARVALLYALAYHGVPAELQEIQRAIRAMGKEVVAVEAKRAEDLEPAFAEMAKAKADALVVIENPMFFFNRNVLVALADKHRLPAIYRTSDYVTAGGLASYGASYTDLCRRAAVYADKILKGAKPGDLPIEQPVKFELVLNQRTAKAMGLAIPRDLLARADQVID
jgi:putative ABC transport system substrate-binding protein